MVRNWFIRILLAPLALIYGLGVSLRNILYDSKILRSVSFSIPVIGMGNLSMGGSGKTPHVEYLIRMLKENIHIATLSRGYGRKSRGFGIVNRRDNALHRGDEPVQFKRKYPDITVAVAENRALGVPKLLQNQPQVECILLDDAYQHRGIAPGIQILLTEYKKPYFSDFLLPSGRLREWRNGSKRADIIIVTKCPDHPESIDRDRFEQNLNIQDHQQLYFSYYRYGSPYSFFEPTHRLDLHPEMEVLLVSGIARPSYLEDYVEEKVGEVHSLTFEDHHRYTKQDAGQMIKMYKQLEASSGLVLTTEKDATRLEEHFSFFKEEQLPLFILPVAVDFHFGQKEEFDQTIRNFLLNFKV